GRAGAAGRRGRLGRTGRHLDHPDRHLPREPGQRLAAPGLRLPRGRAPGAPGPAARPLARRAAAGAPQPGHHLTARLTLERAPRLTLGGMALTVSALAQTAGPRAAPSLPYGRVGLPRAPARAEAGYRLNDRDAVGRLRLIKGAQ